MSLSLDSVIESHKPKTLQSWAKHDDDVDTQLHFDFAHIALTLNISHILANDTYRISAIAVRDINAAVRRRDLDPIRHDVRSILTTASTTTSSNRPMQTYTAILQALERVAEFEAAAAAREKEERRHGRGWDAAAIDTWDEVLANPFGLDVSTIRDTAHHLLGQTPEQLVAGISDEFRVVHMESVVRPDLLQRFLHYQRALGETLDAGGTGQNLRKCVPPGVGRRDERGGGGGRRPVRREDVIADMVRPRVTFHGTPLKSVRSIIRHGFAKPGRIVQGKVVASPRSGVAFANRGIYSSPSPGYALSYAVGHGREQQRMATPLGMLPSLRLFVCATIMGRTYAYDQNHCSYDEPLLQQPDVHGPLVDGYDAHFDGGYEYITHHEAAILPCYVIHLDLGSEAARRAISLAQTDPRAYQQQVHAARERRLHPKLADVALAPGDRKRASEARKAAAMKWFPYGYGSAQETRFVVEEVGEVSDDEEEYGEWQADKQAYLTVDKEGHWLEDENADTYVIFGAEEGEEGKKGLFMDGYQTARY
ncbi:hypothetical protein PWT90_09733 [Aphanocladium album]|nr:hypothetical protein PWT90_09733 [Aphanocladium album]